MRVLLQRVSEAGVAVDGTEIAAIGAGLLVLFCAEDGDDPSAADAMARKTANLRIFEDPDGKMNLSALDVGGAILVVSQFTLAADTRKGNRPGFSRAAAPDTAAALMAAFCDQLRALGLTVETGRFGAHMAVRLINDGPVTIWLEGG